VIFVTSLFGASGIEIKSQIRKGESKARRSMGTNLKLLDGSLKAYLFLAF
jgi:hypothetical protein